MSIFSWAVSRRQIQPYVSRGGTPGGHTAASQDCLFGQIMMMAIMICLMVKTMMVVMPMILLLMLMLLMVTVDTII